MISKKLQFNHVTQNVMKNQIIQAYQLKLLVTTMARKLCCRQWLSICSFDRRWTALYEMYSSHFTL